MKNIDKIAHLDNMIAKCQQSIDFNRVKLEMQTDSNGKAYHKNIEDLFMADLLALKYARKGLQLMIDLINDENEGGEYGF